MLSHQIRTGELHPTCTEVNKMADNVITDVTDADLEAILDMLDNDFFENQDDIQLEFEVATDEVRQEQILETNIISELGPIDCPSSYCHAVDPKRFSFLVSSKIFVNSCYLISLFSLK